MPERAPEEFLLDDFRIDLEEPAVAPASWEMPGALGKEEAPAAAWREPQEEVLPLQNLEEVPEAFRGEEPAGFFRRAPAFLVDSLLVCFILLLFVVGAGVALSLKGAPTAWLLSRFWPADALLPFFILAALINGVYFIVSHWLKGRTLGKRLFSLRLIDQDGGPPTLSAAIFHWMGYLVSAVPLGLGFWWALFDQDRFTWHDRLSGTMVVVDSGKTAPA